MNDTFLNYKWTGLTIIKADKIHTDDIGNTTIYKGGSDIYQIGIKLSGTTEITYNGIDYDYSAGHILYIPKSTSPDNIYKRKIATEGDSSFVFFDSIYELPSTPFSIPCPADSQLAMQFLKISELYKNGDLLSSMENFYRLIRMLSKTMQSLQQNSSIYERILPAKKYITEHICDEYIDINYLSALCRMTPGYFKHQFKNALGQPPLQYINQQKCLYAKQLLCNAEIEVKEIANKIGFTDSNYFSRFFRKHTNMSPTQYRKIYTRNM